MFKQVMFVQWKWTRNSLLAMSVLVTIAPALVMRIALREWVVVSASDLITVTNILGAMFALAAICAGVVVQDASVRPDIEGRYIYALSLPVRWQALLVRRIGAGLILLIIPALFVWIGGTLATSLIVIPDSLHSYAGGVAMRFFLASVLSFAVWSVVVRYSGKKSAAMVLAALLVLILLPVALLLAGKGYLIETMFRALIESPSPFSVFTSRWALLDV
jgi:hypothetical protein